MTITSSKWNKAIIMAILTALLTISFFSNNAEAASNAGEQQQIVSLANKLIGTRYVYGGTTTKGFDCSGFIGYLYRNVDVSIPRTSKGMYAMGSTVAKKNLSVGDLVFFNTTGKGVSHVGVYIGNGKFAHASTSRGVRVDKLNDPYYWANKYVGAKRVTNFATIASNN